MPLIVETGEGVVSANSYVTLTEAQSFIDERGLSATLTEGLLLRAMDALSGQRFNGEKARDANPLSWPRIGAYDCESNEIANDGIPRNLINAQIWLAYYIQSGSDPAEVSTPGIKREKVDVIEVEYSTKEGETTQIDLFSLPNVASNLNCLIARGGYIDRA